MEGSWMSPVRRKPRAVVALAASLFLCSLAVTAQQVVDQSAGTLVKGPVVQNVQTDRATLTWVTRRAVGELRTNGATVGVTISEPEYHRVELSGLKPGSRNEYRLRLGGQEVRGTIVTAPLGDAPYTYIVFGDTRTRHEIHAKIVAQILKENPSFVLHAGDLVANGLNQSDWDRFFEIERDLLRNVAFYPVPGNHERNAEVYFQYFAFPPENGHCYSFDWGSAHFAAFDTNDVGHTSKEKADFRQEQIDWLREDLGRNKKPLTFVLTHHPIYSAVTTRRTAAARLAAQLEKVFIEGSVTAVFSGHDHNYQHHVHAGIHYVVSGGGGAPLYPVSPIPEITVKALEIENYVRVRVEGRRASLDALDLAGKVVDSFVMQGRTADRTNGNF
jgi:predicted phosphodiesterase